MTTLDKPPFTQPATVTGTGDSVCGGNIEADDYRSLTEQPDEILADTRFPVPLHVLAAAALLG